MKVTQNKGVFFCVRALLVLMAAAVCCMTVLAAQPTGSIRLTCNGKIDGSSYPMAGDRYALVWIADAAVDAASGTISYSTRPEFAEYDCDWTGLTASEYRDRARDLAEAVHKSGQYDREGTTDAQGNVTFTELLPGVYLLIRVCAAPANEAFLCDPSFQRLPQTVNGELLYQLDVSPKFILDQPEELPDLPQTGQLQWPIPVMLLGGTALFLTGMELRYGKRRTENAEGA